ncbi:hypothetical protein F4801DRAFT_553749 [Xylaria longipes]|nr:hypothetical protein F4801DRAFT_553749 [Xylaria longipes]
MGRCSWNVIAGICRYAVCSKPQRLSVQVIERQVLPYYVSGWLSSRIQDDCHTASGRLVAPNLPLAVLQHRIYSRIFLLLIGPKRGTAELSPRICHVITVLSKVLHRFHCIRSAQPQAE